MTSPNIASLPVFETSALYPSKNQCAQLPAGTKRFVRHVEVSLHESPQEPLPDCPPEIPLLLSKADAGLKDVAKRCGALVLPHEWGLAPTSHTDPFQTILGVPPGKCLAAKVDLLRNVVGPPNSLYDELYEHIDGYYEDVGAKGEPLLWDMRPDQFVLGINSTDPTTTTRLWLVDIEPHLEWPSEAKHTVLA